MPSEELSSLVAAGAVKVLYGGHSGLRGPGNQFWHLDSPGVFDHGEAGDQFGPALAAGDFDNDGAEDLVVGIRAEDVLTSEDHPDAGAVAILYGFPGSILADGFESGDTGAWSSSVP